LSGLPLNHQLTSRGARLLQSAATAPVYRLYALPGTVPPKPGLVRVADGGTSIAVKLWALTPARGTPCWMIRTSTRHAMRVQRWAD
jgi:allophanate hydrolase